MSSLTSFTLTVSGYSSGTIDLSYDGLDFTPSATDSYKSTSGDVFKVFINGVRIYRQDDSIYASGNGFLESTDNQTGNTLNNITDTGTTNWGRTSNTVWVINTTGNKVVLNPTQIAATALYGSTSPGLGITVSNGDIIELRRAVQDLKTPAVDFSNASILTEQDLDNSAKNVFHVAQQAVSDVGDALKYNTGTASFQSYVPGTSSNAKISNVANPTAANDAANKTYVDGSSSTVTVAGAIDSGHISAVAGQITPTNNIATVANSAYKTDIETVADSTYKGKVETVAESVYKGKVETVADSTYKGKVETVAESVYKGKVETVADSTYKTKVESVAGKETEVGRLGHADYSSGTNAYLAKLGVDAFSNATNGYIKKVADIDSNVTTVAGVSGNVTTVATNINNVNAVALSIAGSQTYTVTVAGGVFVLDGNNNPAITLTKGFTYTFDQSDSSNAGHTLKIRDDDDNEYTNGVTLTGTPGSAGAKTVFVVPANAPTTGLRYYCVAHGEGMGNTITTANNDLGEVASIGAANLNLVATNAESNAIVMGIALG